MVRVEVLIAKAKVVLVLLQLITGPRLVGQSVVLKHVP